MTTRRRYGFTLAELLVVITIIGMLMALLIPAVMTVRNTARLTQCGNNLQQLGKAIILYEGAKQHFPGYAKTLGATYRYNINWPIMILPQIQREDLWAEWQSWQGRARPNRNAAIDIDLFKCPSDMTSDAYMMSYVANCGMQDSSSTTYPDWPENGVFQNHAEITESGARGISVANQKSLSTSEIKDGAQNTILLTENLQARYWVSLSGNTAMANANEYQIGVLWWAPPPNIPVGNARPHFKINFDKDTTSTPNAYYARPSSNHGNVVNVVFCDGHRATVRDSIEYYIYAQLMTPNGREAKLPGSTRAQSLPNDWVRPVTEKDLN